MIVIGGPGGDFERGALILGIRLDPFKDFPVAFSGGQFLFQCFRIDAREFKKMLIKWAGVMILAVFAIDLGAAFVEAARKDDIPAEADARTAGSLFGQIK